MGGLPRVLDAMASESYANVMEEQQNSSMATPKSLNVRMQPTRSSRARFNLSATNLRVHDPQKTMPTPDTIAEVLIPLDSAAFPILFRYPQPDL